MSYFKGARSEADANSPVQALENNDPIR
jgi:hypothetical protein